MGMRENGAWCGCTLSGESQSTVWCPSPGTCSSCCFQTTEPPMDPRRDSRTGPVDAVDASEEAGKGGIETTGRTARTGPRSIDATFGNTEFRSFVPNPPCDRFSGSIGSGDLSDVTVHSAVDAPVLALVPTSGTRLPGGSAYSCMNVHGRATTRSSIGDITTMFSSSPGIVRSTAGRRRVRQAVTQSRGRDRSAAI
jgi:hypothetical protein